MTWETAAAVGTAFTAATLIAGIVYGAGRMSNAIETMAKSIDGLIGEFKGIAIQTNNNSTEIAVHQQRLDGHEDRLKKANL